MDDARNMKLFHCVRHPGLVGRSLIDIRPPKNIWGDICVFIYSRKN